MRVLIAFTQEPIRVPAPGTGSREIGACVEFYGLVRELENGETLAGLGYEAYEPMARRQLERIFKQLQSRHPVAAVTFIHRLGWVPVGEASLFVRVESKHRGPALAFCEECINELKRDVPIWKTAACRPLPGAL